MAVNLTPLVDHTGDDECVVCRAQDIAASILVPAAAAWEQSQGLPRFSLAIHGAAGLLGVMLEDGVDRRSIEAALTQAFDDIEEGIVEDRALGGPPQGSA